MGVGRSISSIACRCDRQAGKQRGQRNHACMQLAMQPARLSVLQSHCSTSCSPDPRSIVCVLYPPQHCVQPRHAVHRLHAVLRLKSVAVGELCRLQKVQQRPQFAKAVLKRRACQDGVGRGRRVSGR
eukprot:365860-Chlamydomonas_euryale.AAC.2